jgi:hypothetical protein
MKLNTVVVLCLTACMVSVPVRRCAAQEKKIAKKDVPSAVISAFEKAYPKAVVKGFAREVEKGKTYYEIESMDGKTGRDILYLADGTVAEVEETVAPPDLPGPVRDAVAAKYPQGKIVKAEKTTRGAEVSYEMRLTSGKGKVNLKVDASGKILKEHKATSKKPEKEEKED